MKFKKLTEVHIDSIRQRYTRHMQTQKQMAEFFNVSERTIGRVLKHLGLIKPVKKELHGIDIVNYLVNAEESMFYALIGAAIEQRYSKQYNTKVETAMLKLSQRLGNNNVRFPASKPNNDG